MMPGDEKVTGGKASEIAPTGSGWTDVAKAALPVIGTIAAAFLAAKYTNGNSTGFKIDGDKNTISNCTAEGHTQGYDIKGSDNTLKNNSASGPGCTIM